MIRFNNDYNHGAHPSILKALVETNDNAYGGYGLDELCEQAAADIMELIDCPEAQVHFLVGGTQMNFIALEAMLRPYEAVISADTGHIAVHESGSIENTGHKVHVLPSVDGKITAEQIRENASYYIEHELKEHMTQPKAVYLSFPTEFGTIYSKAELESIAEVCREYDLFLYIDGARMGYGLASADCDVTLADITRLADAYYIGGTKCGALFGEAFVTTHPAIQHNFRNYMKMNGALLAKGWLLGLQFHELFKDGEDCLYFSITDKAVRQAEKLQAALHECGIKDYIKSQSNQLFVVLPKRYVEAAQAYCAIELDHWVDDDNAIVRFCTAWSSTDEEVDGLIEVLKAV